LTAKIWKDTLFLGDGKIFAFWVGKCTFVSIKKGSVLEMRYPNNYFISEIEKATGLSKSTLYKYLQMNNP